MMHKSCSRKNIANGVRLTRASIIMITSNLITEGYVIENGVMNLKNVERKEVKLQINKNKVFALGFDVSKHSGFPLVLLILTQVFYNFKNLNIMF